MPKLREPKAGAQEELDIVAAKNDAGDPVKEQDDVVVVEDEAGVDAAAELQKQIDDLKKSERIQRDRADAAERQRQEALTLAQEREHKIVEFQKEVKQSHHDAISSALAAATAEAEKAQQDIEVAIAQGNTQAQAEAYRRLARAETNIARLEDGKSEIEADNKRESEVVKPKVSDDPLERTNLPTEAKNWLRKNPEYLTDNRKNAKIQSLHWDVIDEGHTAFSPSYFESLEEHLGMRESKTQDPPSQRTPVVSAPVSREVPSSSNGNRSSSKITLTPMQKEAAKMAGISETEYAKQLLKLNEMKANGHYSGGN